MRARYSRWDGTQDPLGPDLSACDLLEAMSEDILSGDGRRGALSRMLRRGHERPVHRAGRAPRAARAGAPARTGAAEPRGPAAGGRASACPRSWRTNGARCRSPLEDDARMREQFLDIAPARPRRPDRGAAGLPVRRPGGAADVRRADAVAARAGPGVVLPEHGRGHAVDVARGSRGGSRTCWRELNELIGERERGELDTQATSARSCSGTATSSPRNRRTSTSCSRRWPGGWRRCRGCWRRCRPSSGPSSRRWSEQVLQDMDLAFQVSQLVGSLAGMFPQMPWDEPALAGGEDAMPLSATVDALERISDYEDLDRSMAGEYAGASLEDVDEDKLRRTLGEDAVQDVRRPEGGRTRAGTRRPGHAGGWAPGGHAARRAKVGRARAGPAVRTAAPGPRGRARHPRGRRPGRADRGDPAVALRRQRAHRGAAHACSTRSSRQGASASPPTAPRRLRAGRGGVADRGGHGAAARPVVLDAAARPLGPGEANGARAARADRGTLPERHAVPDRASATTRGACSPRT